GGTSGGAGSRRERRAAQHRVGLLPLQCRRPVLAVRATSNLTGAHAKDTATRGVARRGSRRPRRDRLRGLSHRRCPPRAHARGPREDRKSTRLNSSHVAISYAVFCLKKKKEQK